MSDIVHDVSLGDIATCFDSDAKFSDFEKFFVRCALEDAHDVADKSELLLPVIRDDKYKSYAVLLPFFFDVVARFIAKNDSIKRQKLLNMLKVDGIIADETAHRFVVVSIFEIMHKLFGLNTGRIKKGGTGFVNLDIKWFALAVYESHGIPKEVMVLPFRKGVIGTLVDGNGEMQEALHALQVDVKHTQKAFGPYGVNGFWEDEERRRGHEKIVIKKWL